MRRTHRLPAVAGALTALALLAAGCSGGGGDSPTITPVTGSAAAAPAPTAATAAAPTDAVPTTDAAPATAAPTGATSASGGPPPAAGAAPAACGLLTVEQVTTALGAPVTAKPRTETEPLGGTSCLWSSAGVPVRMFQVSIRSTSGLSAQLRSNGQTAEKLFQQTVDFQTTSFPGQVKPLPGVGDKAYVAAGSRAFVLAKGLFVSTDVGFGTSDLAEQALVTLTTAAVAKL